MTTPWWSIWCASCSKDEGCEVEAAADGEEALAAIARHLPDVLLLDLLMPRLDGFGVIEQLEQNPAASSGLPVIVLTAKELGGRAPAPAPSAGS